MKISSTSERLKEIMSSENLKQVDIIELAKPFCAKYDTKITKVDLSQYVSGKVEPGQAKLFVLANALCVNEAWLMGYDVPKERGRAIIANHKEISSETLYAIRILAKQSGFHFSLFANQYQIIYNDVVFKLSPREVLELENASLDQISFVFKNIIDNKLHENITSIRTDVKISASPTSDYIDAAHPINGASNEDKLFDEKIMSDENF